MINLTVILQDVPSEVLKDLPSILSQAKLPGMHVDPSINYDIGYVCIDIEVDETDETVEVRALSYVVDMIDYSNIGEYVQEIGVEK